MATFHLLPDRTPPVLTVAGEVDMVNRDQFALALERLGPVGVVDLSAVTFMDSSGIKALASAAYSGTELTVRSPSPALLRVFDLIGLEAAITIEP